MPCTAARALGGLLLSGLFAAQQAGAQGRQAPQALPGIHGPSASSQRVGHAMTAGTLQSLIGKRLRDPGVTALIRPGLQRLLGARYERLRDALVDDQPLRRVGNGIVAEGVVPGTLGYRGAFVVFMPGGDMLAVMKEGRHGTSVERFGSLAPLADPALQHAYQEFLGIDE